MLAIRFEGNDALGAGELRQRIETKTRPRLRFWADRPPLDAATVEEDAERIERFYRVRGWFETEVHAALDWNEARSGAVVTFEIEEGEPVVLAERRIAVPDPFDADAITRDLPLDAGDVFSVERYDEAKAVIQRRLAAQGHPRAEVTGGADVYLDRHEAELTWQVEPGPLVHFGAVELEGPEIVDARLVERRVAVEPGEAYALDPLEETRADLTALGVFRSVVVQPQPGEAEPGSDGFESWPVRIELEPRPPRRIRAGVGWGTEERWRAQLGFEHRNLFGGAQRLQAKLLYSSIETSVRVGYDVPDWHSPVQTLAAESWFAQEHTVAYEALRAVTTAEVERKLGARTSARFGFGVSWDDVTDTSGAARDFLEEPERASLLVGPRFGVRRSSVDDVLDPSQGTWLDFELHPWFDPRGEEPTFLALAAEARGYRRLGPTVLAGRVRLATLETVAGGGADEIPLPLRLYAGGGASLRGFAYQGLGPAQADGEPIGGASLVEASVELRFPIRGPLSGVAFVDAGQVDLDPHAWSLDEPGVAVGAGLRYRTPLGPVRLDLAFPVVAPDRAETSFFYISIGQAF